MQWSRIGRGGRGAIRAIFSQDLVLRVQTTEILQGLVGLPDQTEHMTPVTMQACSRRRRQQATRSHAACQSSHPLQRA